MPRSPRSGPGPSRGRYRRRHRHRHRRTTAPPTGRTAMPEVVEHMDIDASPERVWEGLTDWASQGEWMLATEVRTVGGPARGVGGRLAARAGLPLPVGLHVELIDTMVITKWDPPRLVEV